MSGISGFASSVERLPTVLGGPPPPRLAYPSWPIFGDKESELLRQVVESGVWSGEGPSEQRFERRFAELHTARFGLCVANGTVALQLALEALGIGAGDEVIVPGFSWQATAATALDVNAVPVLVDADPETYCPDPALIEAAITPRTKAIVVVHLYSCLADMDRILAIARRHGLFVVEDCAHAAGSRWSGRGAGSLGDIGTFSFQSRKTLTAGEGGFVLTNDPALRERLYSLRTCGRRRSHAQDALWRPVQSGNYRMTEWQSAVLGAQLDRFPEQVARRAENALMLDQALSGIPGVAPLRRHPQVTRRNPYAYVFRYDPTAFDGLSGRAFRAALTAELGFSVRQPYTPLNRSCLYQPDTKRRHDLSPEYRDAVNPARFNLPVAWRAFEYEAMLIPHEVLLAEPAALDAVPEAIMRLQRNASRLVAWERSAPALFQEAPLGE